MMKKLFKVALMVAALVGFEAINMAGAQAAEAVKAPAIGMNQLGLAQYAMILDAQKAQPFAPFKVASRRSRRRNRAIVGGIAVGIAALIIAESVREDRRRQRNRNRTYYNDNRSYSTYPNERRCRRWARRCDRGYNRACRKWNRYCEE